MDPLKREDVLVGARASEAEPAGVPGGASFKEGRSLCPEASRELGAFLVNEREATPDDAHPSLFRGERAWCGVRLAARLCVDTPPEAYQQRERAAET